MKEEMKKLFIECCNQIQIKEIDEDKVEITNFDEILSEEFINRLLEVTDGAENLEEEIRNETFKIEILNAIQDNEELKIKVDCYLKMVSAKLLEKLSAGQPELPEQPQQAEKEEGKSELEEISNQKKEVEVQKPLTKAQNTVQPVETQTQETNRLEPTNQITPAMLVMNREDIVDESNAEIARLIMNMKTDNGLNCVRMSEAMMMNDIIEKQSKEIEVLRADKNNLMNLIKGSTAIMKKNNDLKERQFKQTAKEINSRTNITGLHVEVSEPIIPNKVDFTQLEKLMNEAEAEFNTQYDAFENVLKNTNSDLDTLNNLYTKNIDILKNFRE